MTVALVVIIDLLMFVWGIQEGRGAGIMGEGKETQRRERERAREKDRREYSIKAIERDT